MIQGTEEVTILRSTVVISGPNKLPVETTTRTLVKNVLVSWNSSSTTEDLSRMLVNSDITFYFPKGTIIDDRDRFEYRGQIWESSGRPQYWQAPQGFSLQPGVVVNANLTEG